WRRSRRHASRSCASWSRRRTRAPTGTNASPGTCGSSPGSSPGSTSSAAGGSTSSGCGACRRSSSRATNRTGRRQGDSAQYPCGAARAIAGRAARAGVPLNCPARRPASTRAGACRLRRVEDELAVLDRDPVSGFAVHAYRVGLAVQRVLHVVRDHPLDRTLDGLAALLRRRIGVAVLQAFLGAIAGVAAADRARDGREVPAASPADLVADDTADDRTHRGSDEPVLVLHLATARDLDRR